MRARQTGYSGTPLYKKLGIRQGDRIKTKNAPVNYRELLPGLPQDVLISSRLLRDIRIFHLFTASRRELASQLRSAKQLVFPAGMIWVSWPKKSSGIASEIAEDTIRELALPLGLVDVKVCAVDEIWSGLKLVIRRENR